jgi:hypothetical protein
MTAAVDATTEEQVAVVAARPAVVRGPLIAAAAFLVTCLAFIALVPLADDEGQLSYMSARMMLTAPMATLFFQKLRPFMTAVYAPIVAGGESYYLVAHSAVAALGVWLAGKLAARVGGVGWLASVAIAANPIYFLASVSGQSNTDGITALLGGAFMLAQERTAVRVLGGMLLGATPWIRYETFPAVAIFGLYLLVRRDWRAVAGYTVWPVVYLGAGAVYHHEALWFLHFSPTFIEPPDVMAADFPVPGDSQGSAAALSDVLVTASAACATWPLSMTVRLREVSSTGRVLVASLLLLVPLMFGLPFTGFMTFELQARYQMVVLPAMAVAASVAILRPTRLSRAMVLLAGVLLLATAAATSFASGWELLTAPLLIGSAMLLRTQRQRCIAAVVGLAAYAVLLPVSGARSGRFLNPLIGAETQAFLRWFADHRSSIKQHVVYTTHPQIGMMAQRLGQPVRFIVPRDMVYELTLMVNHENGQSEQIIRAISPELYGGALWPCEVPDVTFEPGDVIVYRGEDRSTLVLWDEAIKSSIALNNDTPPLRVVSVGPNPMRLTERDIPMSKLSALFHGPCEAFKKVGERR